MNKQILKIDSKYKIFDYVIIVLAVIAVVLLFFDKIPRPLYIPLLLVIIAIFILRILIKGYLINKSSEIFQLIIFEITSWHGRHFNVKNNKII